MNIPIEAEVQCSDGPCGQSTHIILNPQTKRVTYLVVKEKQSPHLERLVPVDLVDQMTSDIIRLQCSEHNLAIMEPYQEAREKKSATESNQATMDIDHLVAGLANPDGRIRRHRREALVARGEEAVPFLIKVLADSPEYVRWEAAKALSEIGTPAAAPALVTALQDDSFGIRWLAAEGLIATGRAALPALLQALIQHADSVRLRDGAHHVLLAINRGGLHLVEPVIRALEDIEPAVEVPQAAHTALANLVHGANRGW